ncbi:DUF3095 domain-containing protein [Poseidonibacter lekithochrous]|uniref:DUF3095 domain-containing protein n=1 Tax=Poseidonibacter lekithochrous TaxID=1904463 RepID=UPI0008FCDB5D|nr:DUF3095 domain-containing protein [Poseidonibacter lekithochrous]QKJ23624.1 DUF3095 domain-containing protein [Poseidonibacter lekithochrous]
MNDDFYSKLKAINSIKEIAKNNIYSKLPKDWYILATDIKDSTIAIKEGKYKEVNMVGALTIISILNINKNIDLPYVFGGDGAFVIIPQSIYHEAKQSLLAIQKISKDAYSLDLRIASICIDEVCKNNKEVLISKLKVSKDYYQAIINGGGLELCDDLLKNSNNFLINDKIDENFQVDISGLECRWEAIPSPKDDTLSILIKSKNESYYENILSNIESIIGDNKKRHPILENALKLSFKDKDLNYESSIYSQNFFMKRLINLKLKMINVIGYILMKLNLKDWSTYKQRVLSTTDTEKFDDILRMVVSTSKEETQILEEYLEKEFQKNTLIYGIHKSDSALMTCLIFERHGRHIHFVDGSNGGYALAAKDFKNRVAI